MFLDNTEYHVWGLAQLTLHLHIQVGQGHIQMNHVFEKNVPKDKSTSKTEH